VLAGGGAKCGRRPHFCVNAVRPALTDALPGKQEANQGIGAHAC